MAFIAFVVLSSRLTNNFVFPHIVFFRVYDIFKKGGGNNFNVPKICIHPLRILCRDFGIFSQIPDMGGDGRRKFLPSFD